MQNVPVANAIIWRDVCCSSPRRLLVIQVSATTNNLSRHVTFGSKRRRRGGRSEPYDHCSSGTKNLCRKTTPNIDPVNGGMGAGGSTGILLNRVELSTWGDCDGNSHAIKHQRPHEYALNACSRHVQYWLSRSSPLRPVHENPSITLPQRAVPVPSPHVPWTSPRTANKTLRDYYSHIHIIYIYLNYPSHVLYTYTHNII